MGSSVESWKKTFLEPALLLNRLCNVLVAGADDEVPYEVN